MIQQRFFPVCSAGGPREQLWHRQGCPLFDIVNPAFPLPSMASPTLQGAQDDAFGEAVVKCNIPGPCNFTSNDSGQKRFLWTHKNVDLAPHSVVSLVLHVGDMKKFHQAHGFKNLDPFFQSQQAGSMFHSHRGGWR